MLLRRLNSGTRPRRPPGPGRPWPTSSSPIRPVHHSHSSSQALWVAHSNSSQVPSVPHSASRPQRRWMVERGRPAFARYPRCWPMKSVAEFLDPTRKQWRLLQAEPPPPAHGESIPQRPKSASSARKLGFPPAEQGRANKPHPTRKRQQQERSLRVCSSLQRPRQSVLAQELDLAHGAQSKPVETPRSKDLPMLGGTSTGP